VGHEISHFYKERIAFYAVKKKYKSVNKFFSQKERWMPNLRQQTRRSAVWADLTKQITNSSQKGLLYMYK
jgi:hypothetical protein